MVTAVVCMSFLDATSKYLAQQFPPAFVVWVRYCLQSLTLIALLGPQLGRRLMVTSSPGLQILRGGALVTSSLMMVIAFRYLPLADATAINFAAPTLVTVLAVLLLHEHVTFARAISVTLGMIGLLLIVRPGAGLFHGAALFALVAAFANASYQILTRKLAADDSRTMLFYASVVGAIAMSCAAPWRDVDLARVRITDVGAMLAMGWLATGGHFLFIRALQRAPASGLAAFTYLQLVFATLIGLAWFGNFPDHATLLGMAVITASGAFLTWYERRRAVVQPNVPPAID